MDYVVESDPVAFKSDRFMIGDKYLWLELSRLTKFKYIDEALATYNKLPESQSHSKDIRKLKIFHFSSFDMTHYYVEKYGCTDKLPKSFLGRYAEPLLSYSYHNWDVEMAVMVKDKQKHLSFKQRLLYWGTIYPVIHFLLWPLVNSKRFIGKLVTVLRV